VNKLQGYRVNRPSNKFPGKIKEMRLTETQIDTIRKATHAAFRVRFSDFLQRQLTFCADTYGVKPE
jgi:hypothetical protein